MKKRANKINRSLADVYFELQVEQEKLRKNPVIRELFESTLRLERELIEQKIEMNKELMSIHDTIIYLLENVEELQPGVYKPNEIHEYSKMSGALKKEWEVYLKEVSLDKYKRIIYWKNLLKSKNLEWTIPQSCDVLGFSKSTYYSVLNKKSNK